MDLKSAHRGDLRERRSQAFVELAVLVEERGSAAFEPSPDVLIHGDRER